MESFDSMIHVSTPSKYPLRITQADYDARISSKKGEWQNNDSVITEDR